jgi:MATE family multidrug resistance protein
MLCITLITVTSNAVLNQILIFVFNLGVAGSAWASTIAQAIALVMALHVFLNPHNRRGYRSHLTWRLDPSRSARLFAIGFSSSLLIAADRVAMALFQLMQARFSSDAGAVTQIALTLSSIAYLPGVGIAMAGATLVGHALGAGDLSGARRIGGRTTAITVVFMGSIGLLIALSGPWLLPIFIDPTDPQASSIITRGVAILWLAAICQIVDAAYLSYSFCLRSAGDTTIPAALGLVLAWIVFIPMSHAFMFKPGDGWITSWPSFGWGLTGGWCALVIYCVLLSAAMFLRWQLKWSRGAAVE